MLHGSDRRGAEVEDVVEVTDAPLLLRLSPPPKSAMVDILGVGGWISFVRIVGWVRGSVAGSQARGRR